MSNYYVEKHFMPFVMYGGGSVIVGQFLFSLDSVMKQFEIQKHFKEKSLWMHK